jgi:hypothetical protein
MLRVRSEDETDCRNIPGDRKVMRIPPYLREIK